MPDQEPLTLSARKLLFARGMRTCKTLPLMNADDIDQIQKSKNHRGGEEKEIG
jgi:hypothetical protein